MSQILSKDTSGHWGNRLHEKSSFTPKVAPKGSRWKISYRHWQNGGNKLYEAIVHNYTTGLTAFEAYQAANFEPNPAFHECVCDQLDPFPTSKRTTAKGTWISPA